MFKNYLGIVLVFVFIFSICITVNVLSYTQSGPDYVAYSPHIKSLPGNTEVIATIYLPLRNQNLLFYYSEEVSMPGSPLYHKFLTQSQVRSLFYPTQEFNDVMSTLKAHGVNVIFAVADSVIVVKGRASQLSSVLGVRFFLYDNGTKSYYFSEGNPPFQGTVIGSNVSALFFSHPSTLVTTKNVINLEKSIAQVNSTFPVEGYPVTYLRGAYNITSLLSRGINGSGYTVGILDFYGDPYIQQQLAYFDKIYGLPAPPNFSIIPIGPYNPNLGIKAGWAGEISLDVESVHAMSPGASIILYIANPNLPLSSIIANIVSQDKVDVLSQSFSIPDELIPSLTGSLFYQCVVLTDQYYAMGNAEGITFLASSGDGGGSGYSAGPLGSVGYPSTSPFVTALGGTTTYITFDGYSFNVTAWSNYGFVPPDANYGGSTGGISQVEPKPFYQWSIPTPKGYPNGRETPDVSANADVYPGIFIVCPGNVTAISGGTSEASPLTAGLLTLVMQFSGSRLGNLNPLLYSLAKSSYSSVFVPIEFGYNIPWVASYGYNLVTGLGQLNIGNLAYLTKSQAQKELSVMVNDSNVSVLIPGQTLTVTANVTMNGTVSTGSFFVTLETVDGNVSTSKMSFDPSTGLWTATLTVPQNDQGVTFITVWGESNGLEGYGLLEAFSGYFAQFLPPTPFSQFPSLTPYSVLWSGFGIPIVVNLTTPTGALAPNITLTAEIFSYNITNNSYTLVNTTQLSFNPALNAWTGMIPSNIPVGPTLVEIQNAFGYVAFFNGVGLSNLFILPPTVAEPGSVYPGQPVIVTGSLTPPSNIPSLATAQNLMSGSNLTAELLSPSGKVVSTAQIPYSFNPLSPGYLGYLYVPNNATPGLYTILLFSSYYSYTLGQDIPGFYYGQIYVAGKVSPILNFSSRYLLQGSVVKIYAKISQDGSPIKFGMFSATVFPNVLSSVYSFLSSIVEVPLWYNSTSGMWEGNLTLPSPNSLGNLSYLTNGYYSLPFKVLVTGVSAYGGDTATGLSRASQLFVEPYTLIKNDPSYTQIQTYDVAFQNDTITLDGNMFNDLFLGNNTILDSNLVITSSNDTGTLLIKDSSVTLIDVQATRINAVNSTVKLVSSSVEYISLNSSRLQSIQSSYSKVYPSPPVISVGLKPFQNLTGTISFPVTVQGSSVSNVTVELDGVPIATYNENGTHSVTLNTTLYPDGNHVLTVLVQQTDGVSSKVSLDLLFQNQLSVLTHTVTVFNNVTQQHLRSLSSTSAESLYLGVIGLVVGLVALAIALLSLRRK
ncbi:S8 family serine peptidase [Metallosphaera tengchongensis]|uniref:S8 family serine peptidase n=1 Tax=Metallosphaera tengchongensis TaxID=1532350 RepID=A0A6N0NUR5_9CREN|nr:protease pro-enzyme activation domain-containing protein [Metallosphaera tengchongensis]QKR00614.1 S8 family serine peptidase [Metallosphaera tengchongensis]